MITINPGTGPVPDATEANAGASAAVFVLDLSAKGLPVADAVRSPEQDHGEGRYAFTLTMADPTRRTVEVQMPGLSIERVRFMGEDGQNIWHFPRLYVDGSSCVWQFALDACEPDEEDGE
ncbi:hypothetical protein ACH41H_36355 [Streptomyces sp. NPDC020800]|uniref:hypothetical protein n=1 Tax=Streptomyces sp. NPDC020800 TaxID=3365092 RepID=UPI0037AF6FA4